MNFCDEKKHENARPNLVGIWKLGGLIDKRAT